MSKTAPPAAEVITPQIYLITPPAFELSEFPDRLAAVLDAHEIACLRLSMATKDEDRIARAADTLREIAHARDLAIVIDSHVAMVERLGLDGVHLTDAARSVRKVRAELGADAIVGTFCGTSRHDGMSAAEADADYAAFGPVGTTTLGTGDQADVDLFEWWSEVIEIPIVAEGALDLATVEALAGCTDFFAVGEEIWTTDNPAAALKALLAPLG
jgi:thiamine-phosphate pyrophosphorylase